MRGLIVALVAATTLSVAPSAAADAQVVELLQADIETAYADLAASSAGRFAVKVDSADGNLAVGRDPASGRLRILYRMNFNQVAEGWSWQPQADPAVADYYRFKFLPLGTRERQQGAPYVQEDMPGRPREVKRLWQFDYFFAFDNPYDFFARPTIEDDAGFAAELTLDAARAAELAQPGRVGMLAWGRFTEPQRAESTTFWKATDGKPVDLTLKNRYLIGQLEEVWFVDTLAGDILAKLVPRASAH